MNKTIVILFLSFLFIQCSDNTPPTNACNLSNQIDFLTFTIDICDDMTHVELQGIDSQVGELNKNDNSLKLNYDIGFLAGLYVDSTSNKTIENAVNHEFWHIEKNNQFVITFPLKSQTAGWDFNGINFYTENISEKDLIIDIMKTVEIK